MGLDAKQSAKTARVIKKAKRPVEISEVTGKPKIARVDRGRIAAAKAATMTKEEWKGFQEKYSRAWPKPEYMGKPREKSAVLRRDGGEGSYRDQTYEIVTRWRADTKIQLRPHAKAPGSKSHVRYETYSKAKTVGEMLALGCYPMDWCFDYEHGFIKVTGPVRQEALDPSRVQNDADLTDVDNCIMHWIKREIAKKHGLDIKDLTVQKGGGETIIMRAHRLVANRDAETTLTAAALNKKVITDEDVQRVMLQWAFAKNVTRQNVMPEGQTWVWSDSVGLLRDRLGDIHVTHNAKRYPAFTQLIVKWLVDRLPKEVQDFTFTSLNLNCNYAAKRHRDGQNFGPSMIKAFGDFSGGELNVFPEDDRDKSDLSKLPASDKRCLNIKDNLAMFNGNSAHEVEEFQGTRLSIVYFTLGCHDRAKDEDVELLRQLGFPFPAKDEDPYKHIRAPMGYGKKTAAHGKTLMTWKCSDLVKKASVKSVKPLKPVMEKIVLKRSFSGKPGCKPKQSDTK
mmetsp:Transcript_112278/g.194648  ORF Transcript_112278/g.194648 Transcript_112278/m.194648 type:complete len:508 (-) Transcript_112278:96-1619(-)